MLRDSDTIKPVHRRILYATTLGWIFDFFDFVLFTYLLIPMRQELGLSHGEVASALGLSLLFTALGGMFFGYLADRIGRKKTLILTILIYSVGGVLTMFTQSFAWLLFSRAVTGFGVGGEWGVGQSLLAETIPAHYRGRFGAIMHSGLSVGIILAYLLGAFAMPVIGWRWCFASALVAAAIVLPLLLSIPESDVWQARRKKDSGSGVRVPLRMIIEGRTPYYALLGLVFMTLEFAGYWLLTSWFPTYLHDQRGMSITHSALWLIVLNVGGVIGYVSAGFVSDRFGRRRVLTTYKIIEAIAVLPITLFWSGSGAVLLLCMFFIGFGGGGTALIGPLFNEIFPGPVRSTLSNSCFNIARGLQYFTPILGAAWAATVGFGEVLSTASICFLLLAALVWLFPETSGRTLTD